jgi:hypothetical protein
MARPLRIEFPGTVYHVTSRGDRCEPIFVDAEDRLVFRHRRPGAVPVYTSYTPINLEVCRSIADFHQRRKIEWLLS